MDQMYNENQVDCADQETLPGSFFWRQRRDRMPTKGVSARELSDPAYLSYTWPRATPGKYLPFGTVSIIRRSSDIDEVTTELER
jgi:hypothetical protein